MEAVLDNMKVDRSVPPSPDFTGGTTQARKRLTSFLRSDLDGYESADKNCLKHPH